MINRGAFKIIDDFLTDSELDEAITLADESYKHKSRTHDGGSKYGTLDWFYSEVVFQNPIVIKFLKKFNLDKSDITKFVIYYLEPGSNIPPHRDNSGASINDRIRFHIPIKTNDSVEFIVTKEKIKMIPGDLWILDTSYEHSVYNGGSSSRSHFVIECEINSTINKYLFNDLRAKIHTLEFYLWGLRKLLIAILINSWSQPKYAKAQLKILYNFFVKRFFRD